MSCITTGWRKIGKWFGITWFYLTELALFITILVVLVWLLGLAAGSGAITPFVAKVLAWVWIIWMIVTLVLLGVCLIVYLLDTLCNFLTNLWRRGWSAAWNGAWRDLARSFGWFVEEAASEIYDRTQERIKKVKDFIVDAKDKIVEKGGEVIDWIKGWFKSKN